VAETEAQSGEPRTSLRQALTIVVDGGQSLPITTQGTGYLHAFNNSRFQVGSNPTILTQFGLQKVVGSDGVFGTVPETGWAMGIPNARAPSKSVAPLTSSGDVHNKMVVSYFVGAGLPAGQVGDVNAHAFMEGSGVASGPQRAAAFAGFSSVIHRVVAGISVPDSFAWARFNADNNVVEESVYWPALPDAVISQATVLSASLANTAQLATYVSKLPPGLPPGEVVIRTSAGGDRTGGFFVAASYDVTALGEVGATRHFDANAAEFSLPNEAPVAATN